MSSKNFTIPIAPINTGQLVPNVPFLVKLGGKAGGWIKCVNGSPVFLEIRMESGRVEPLAPETVDIFELGEGDTFVYLLITSAPAFSTFANSNLNIYLYPYNKPEGTYPAALNSQISSTGNAGRVPGLKAFNTDVSAGGTFSINLPAGFSLFCVFINLSFSIPAANAGGNFVVSRLDTAFFPSTITWRTSGGPNLPGHLTLDLPGPLKGTQTTASQLSGMDFTVPNFSTNMWLLVKYYTVAGA